MNFSFFIFMFSFIDKRARKGTGEKNASLSGCSGDVMIFNKNSSSLLPRKKQQNKYKRTKRKTLKNSEERKKGQKRERRRKESKKFSRIERDFSDSHFTRLAPWRSPERKEQKPEKKSEQFLHPSGARRMKIHTFCLKMNFFIAFLLFSAIIPRKRELPFR